MADILIVDDDPDNADALAMLLGIRGHTIRVGYNGEEGIRLARERTPDLAILDVEMPLLDGPGMAYRMFLHNRGLEHVPVVLLSGVTNLPEVAAHLGTTYYLGKPCHFPALVELVDHALRERRAPIRSSRRRHGA